MYLFSHIVVLAVFLHLFLTKSTVKCMSLVEKHKLRDQVKEMFLHGYNSYMKYAYPADELMPLSCKGRVRGVDPSRGDIDDSLGMFSLTLIDSLDSLAVLGELKEFERAVQLVISEVSFDNDIVISVFETNIRVLGGLLGGHMAAVTLRQAGKGMGWYSGELLDMAKDLGYRLLPAFNTTTGIPYPRVNLKYGIRHPESRTGTESDTCTACGGTMIMEFGALTRLTGEPIFEAKARKAMEALWTYRSRHSDLVGTVINIHNGDWVRRDSGVGAGVDSYYEYCFKAYILLGDEIYLQRFNTHYKSIMRYINQGPMFLNVQMHQPDRMAHSYMDALFAFWPGLQVLKGDIKKAIETHDMLYEVTKKHIFLPEAFTTDFEVHWGQHPLRPEFVESTYFLYEATKDPYYLEAGKYIMEKLNLHARVPCGFAAMKDVRTLSHEDKMDSFVLAETFKYLYLLFAEKEDVAFDIHQFIFTTEAHILPISLSTNNVSQSMTDANFESDDAHDYVCPNTLHEGEGSKIFAQEVRKNFRSKPQESCSKKPSTGIPIESNKPPKLRAEEFVPSNADHIEILKTMGIKVVQTDDGRIQLMHTASSALSIQDAASGIKFMQDMIELAKKRGDTENIENNPRVVQIMSAPYHGSVVLNAGPAQFGLDLSKGDFGVGAEVVIGDPIKGCSAMADPESVKHRIVIMERGECMFIDKVRLAQTAGSVGVIVIDNNPGSSSDSQPIFAMSGDGTSNDVQIPAVFLFSNEGNILKKAIEETLSSTGEKLRVRIASKASNSEKQETVDQQEKVEIKPTKITINGQQLHDQIIKSCSSSQQKKETTNSKQLMDICITDKSQTTDCQRFSCSPHSVIRGIAVKCILWRKKTGTVTDEENKDVLKIYSYLNNNLKFGGEILISDNIVDGIINIVQETNGNIIAFSVSQSKSLHGGEKDGAKKEGAKIDGAKIDGAISAEESEEKGCSTNEAEESESVDDVAKYYTKAIYDSSDKLLHIQEVVCKDNVCKMQTKTQTVLASSDKTTVFTEVKASEKGKEVTADDKVIADENEKSWATHVGEKHESISDVIESDDKSETHSQELPEKKDLSEGDESPPAAVNTHKEDTDKNEPNVKEERTSND